MLNDWVQNEDKWIAAVLNLMEDKARTWALPYLEMLAQSLHPFSGSYTNFTKAFTKCFAPLDSTEAAQDALKALKQGKQSVVEYISKFDQFTSQTGWSNANHCTRFYDGLNKAIKDNLAITNQPITSLNKLHTAAQILDQHMRQCAAEKSGKMVNQPMHQSQSKDPNAMDIDATCQSQKGENRSKHTYVNWMKGKCYDSRSPDHTKKDGKHE